MRYHLSPSNAGLLLPPSCPAMFRAAMDAPEQFSVAFDMGQLCHRLVLGEGPDIVVIPAPDYKTSAARLARDTAREQGLIPALQADYDNATLMAAKVHEHPVAGKLLGFGDPEVDMRVHDPATGVELRGRIDWVTLLDDVPVIVDYKTAASAHPGVFARKADDYGYVLQAAWYRRMGQLKGFDDLPRVLFIVQEKTPPHLVSVVELDEQAMRYGARRMRAAIDLFVACVETDSWPGYGDEITTVGLPGWVIQREERER